MMLNSIIYTEDINYLRVGAYKNIYEKHFYCLRSPSLPTAKVKQKDEVSISSSQHSVKAMRMNTTNV